MTTQGADHRERADSALQRWKAAATVGGLAVLLLVFVGYSWVRSQHTSCEVAAQSTLREIAAVQSGLRVRVGSYARDLSALTQDLTGTFQSDVRLGYVFKLVPTEGGWIATANPTLPGFNGDRYFWISESGLLLQRFEAPFTLTPEQLQSLPADAEVVSTLQPAGSH